MRSSSVCELPVPSPWVVFEEPFEDSFLPLSDSWWDSVKPWPGLAMLNPDLSNWYFSFFFQVQVFSFKAP